MPPRDLPKDLVSVATAGADNRMHAPSAARNSAAITQVLSDHAPTSGRALEIASGTGEHVLAFARALPGLDWQPTEINAARRASIDAWAATANLPNLRTAKPLDACTPGWGRIWTDQSLIFLCNLLHLISETEAHCLIAEAAAALAPGGRFLFYGPFLRDGRATSDGDARFHASLKAADPETGYKDTDQVIDWCNNAGLHQIALIEMPANNLLFVMERSDRRS